jgi:hypothetical protein
MSSTSSVRWEPEDGRALSTVAWGVKHWWWVIVIFAVAGSAIVPWYQYRQPKQYDATALVVAADLTASTTVLPRFATSIFDNGVVAKAIDERFGSAGDLEDIVPKEVSMVAAQDSIVLEVIGHSEDKDEAVRIADVAAATFVDELNQPGSGVGVFKLQSPASAPVEATERFKAAPYSLVVGTIGGSILGFGLVLLLLVVRRPVVAGSRRLVGLPIAGVIRVPRRSGTASPEGSVLFEGATAVGRSVLVRDPGLIYVLAPHGQFPLASKVAASLRAVLDQPRSLEAPLRRGGAPGARTRPIVEIESPDDRRLLEMSTSTLVMLVVSEGTTLASVRRIADPFAAENTVAVIVRRTLRPGAEVEATAVTTTVLPDVAEVSAEEPRVGSRD